MIIESTNVTRTACSCCATERTNVTAFVNEGGTARAVVFVWCYPPHGDTPSEIWIDAILGTWGTNDPADHVTFGCRYGAVAGQEAHSCSLTDAAALANADPIFGRRLTAPAARAHDRLPEFWQIVDLVLTTVPEIGDHRDRHHTN